MNIDLIKIIENGDDLEKFQKSFLSDMRKMVSIWKQLRFDLSFMDISKITEIEIREILANIGEEMIKICEIMINENNK